MSPDIDSSVARPKKKKQQYTVPRPALSQSCQICPTSLEIHLTTKCIDCLRQFFGVPTVPNTTTPMINLVIVCFKLNCHFPDTVPRTLNITVFNKPKGYLLFLFLRVASRYFLGLAWSIMLFSCSKRLKGESSVLATLRVNDFTARCKRQAPPRVLLSIYITCLQEFHKKMNLLHWFTDVYKTWTPGPWTTLVDPVHEGVHGPGPQGWSMDLGSMFGIRPWFTE